MGQVRERAFSVLEYNCENMFDTIHQEGLADFEFTPQGAHHWNSKRYWSKLGKMARVLAACGGSCPVDLVALCEVENDSVLYDLTRRTALHNMGYEYIISHGPDVRGINTALLFQPLSFAPIDTQSVRIPHFAGERPTRDVLHVTGRLISGDTLDVIVCHFPSRAGGARKTDPYRRRAASIVRHLADSLHDARSHPAVIIAGDFNDELHNAALSKVLGAMPVERYNENGDSTLVLVDMTPEGDKLVSGTYKFRGEWNHLDHFFLNAELLHPASALYAAPTGCRIMREPFLLETKSPGNLYPRRTFLGDFYNGGISDHLPLLLTLRLNLEE